MMLLNNVWLLRKCLSWPESTGRGAKSREVEAMSSVDTSLSNHMISLAFFVSAAEPLFCARGSKPKTACIAKQSMLSQGCCIRSRGDHFGAGKCGQGCRLKTGIVQSRRCLYKYTCFWQRLLEVPRRDIGITGCYCSSSRYCPLLFIAKVRLYAATDLQRIGDWMPVLIVSS